MKVSQLIEVLNRFDPDSEIVSQISRDRYLEIQPVIKTMELHFEGDGQIEWLEECEDCDSIDLHRYTVLTTDAT